MSQVLDRSTCVELLQTVVIGRVAWVTASGDAIVVPVAAGPMGSSTKAVLRPHRADELTGRRPPLRAGGVTVERQRGETN